MIAGIKTGVMQENDMKWSALPLLDLFLSMHRAAWIYLNLF